MRGRTMIFVALAAVAAAGCKDVGPQTKALQTSFAADQDAAAAVADAVGDPDLQQCTAVLKKTASVPCPTIDGVPGPACLAAKNYVVLQATVHQCAAVEKNALGSLTGLIAGVTALFP